MEEERNQLESEISALKSELKKIKFQESGSKIQAGSDDSGVLLGEEKEKVTLLEVRARTGTALFF